MATKIQNTEDNNEEDLNNSISVRNEKSFIRDIKYKLEAISNIYQTCLKESQLVTNISTLYTNERACFYAFGKINKENLYIVRANKIAKKDEPGFRVEKQNNEVSTSSIRSVLCRPFVQKAMKEFYLKKRILPCYKKFIAFLNNPYHFPPIFWKVLDNYVEFSEFLHNIGYTWQTIPGVDEAFLVEKSQHTKERFHYLDKMMKFREEGRKIVYVAECDLKRKLIKVHYGFLFIAIHPQSGFNMDICWGHFRNSRDKLFYGNWILRTVVPTMDKNSVIVLEQKENSYLKESTDDVDFVPTTMSTKAKMIEWLKLREIPYTNSMHKAELYQLIQSNILVPDNQTRETLDNRIESMGIHVVRRPNWLPAFDYFYKLWEKLNEKNWKQQNLGDIKEFLNCLPRAYWKDLENNLAEREEECMKEDSQIEEMIDSVLTMIKKEGMEVLESEQKN